MERSPSEGADFFFFDRLPKCVREVLSYADYTSPDIVIYQQLSDYRRQGVSDEQYARALKQFFEDRWKHRREAMLSGSREGDIV
jgi:hypothetical protein